MTKNRGRKQRTSKRSQRGGDDSLFSNATGAATGAFDKAKNTLGSFFGNSTPTQTYGSTPETYGSNTQQYSGGKKYKKKRGGSRKRKCKTRKRKTRKH